MVLLLLLATGWLLIYCSYEFDSFVIYVFQWFVNQLGCPLGRKVGYKLDNYIHVYIYF